MPQRKEVLKDLQYESERLLNQLEMILAKQAAQLKEMHIYMAEQHPLSDTVKKDNEALIKDSEELLAKLSDTLASQRRELTEQGVDINRVFTTGSPTQDAALQEKVNHTLDNAQAHARSRAEMAVQKE